MSLYSLPPCMSQPHNEVDEDGCIKLHQGYKVSRCASCGEEFIHSNQKVIETCGLKKCEVGK